ncbi:copper homeostasis periplasmic binding protein CopC [Sphingomonas sp.]|uniref:copper homeostasis periplasmic binding protein CopC n=1 Tax=Sphingomonas sp. TaxID=28214 RepID=UPI0031D972BC
MRSILLSAAVALSALAAPAYAHPKLLSASPAANATVAAPARITLRFSEALIAKFSGAEVAMTGHAGMAHGSMPVAATSAVDADGRTLVLTPKSALMPGQYTVTWHVVSSDTHRITGSVAFTVR